MDYNCDGDDWCFDGKCKNFANIINILLAEIQLKCAEIDLKLVLVV